MEINEDKAETIYSELVVAKKSATTILILAETQRQAEEFMVEEVKAAGVPWLEAVGMEKLKVSWLETGILCNWFGVHIWLFLVSLMLETGTNLRKLSGVS